MIKTLDTPGSMVTPARYLKNRTKCTTREFDVGPKQVKAT